MKTQDELDDGIPEELEAILHRQRYAGNSPRETAEILLRGELKFKNPAFPKAKDYGDAIIPALKEVSEDFAHINTLNAVLIAEVLAAINTPLALSTCRELYASDVELHQLVGAVGLAAHVAEDNFEYELRIPLAVLSQAQKRSNLEKDRMRLYESSDLSLRFQLAICALGNTRSGHAIPYLCRILQINTIQSASNTPYIHAWICEALQKIGDKQAIPVLSERLVDPQFHATEDAFNALYSLNPHEAISAAIQRIRIEIMGHQFALWGTLVQKLETVTHQRFYDNYDAWEQWWEEHKKTWEATR